MRIFTLLVVISLFSCSTNTANTEQRRIEYDSLTKLHIQTREIIDGDREILETGKENLPDTLKFLFTKRLDSLNEADKKIEQRRSILSKEIFGK